MAIKCQDCDEPATVHACVAVQGEVREIHLCRPCAERRQLLGPSGDAADGADGHQSAGDASPAMPAKPSLAPIVQKLTQATEPAVPAPTKEPCPHCGLTFFQFRQSGRLGCPHDYRLFAQGLRPLLDHVHRATHHKGKQPRHGISSDEADQLLSWRAQLKQAVQDEQFDQAAQLRDKIRKREDRHGTE